MARIGIDCRMYSSRFTGIGRYVYELIHNLFKLDSQNEYILFFNDPEYDGFNPPNERVTKVRVNAPHYSFSEQVKFLFQLRKHKLDLMHFTHFNAPVLYKHPSVVTIHDLTLSFYPGKKMTSPLHRYAYKKTIKSAVRNARKVIAVSQNTKKDIQDILSTDEAKLYVIYEAVNPAFRRIEDDTYKIKLKEKFNIDRPFILYTGVWRSHKNLPNLIKAFTILKKEYGYDGKLVVTGKHDPVYAQDIFHLPETIEFSNDIVFTGMVDELELIALYNAAQVYAFLLSMKDLVCLLWRRCSAAHRSLPATRRAFPKSAAKTTRSSSIPGTRVTWPTKSSPSRARNPCVNASYKTVSSTSNSFHGKKWPKKLWISIEQF